MDPNAEILHHVALTNSRLGSPGFALADWENFEVFTESSESLEARGIQIVGKMVEGNKVVLHSKLGNCKLRINFCGKTNSSVYLGSGHRVNGTITLDGQNNLFSASGFGFQGQNSISVTLSASNSAIVFCKDVTSVNSARLLNGNTKRALIGDDCMFSWDIYVRNFDSHAIFDIETLTQINTPGDILIDKHCWIGQGATIIKSLSIGAGSIVGVRSVVTKNVPSKVAVGGVPAKILRRGVTWSRHWLVGETEMRALRDCMIDPPVVDPELSDI
ncbi:acyltransferase [Pseudomonas sp.]|uniref:acyltransferase n=1 Tax=Pseudomonas sp. TaxID=306 RepID=UPI002616622C|nr:acyltransferase [Pseudomonas sp.]